MGTFVGTLTEDMAKVRALLPGIDERWRAAILHGPEDAPHTIFLMEHAGPRFGLPWARYDRQPDKTYLQTA